MPSFDAAWTDLTAIAQLTTTRFNDIKNDLQTWLVALDDDFFGSNVLDANKIDGTGATLGDPAAGPSEQVVTRQTKFSSTLPFTLDTNVRYNVVAKTGAYTVLITDELVKIDNSGGAFTVTLPVAATAGSGFTVTIKKTETSANDITVDGDGATIDGSPTLVFGTGARLSRTFMCDGTGWHVIASF